jgi:holo-[acyl-carrier protein] synthase
MLHTGIDLIEVSRIAATLAKHGERFLRMVYTPREIAHCAGRAHALAARFAAKEATAKALGTGLIGLGGGAGVHWRDIEVVNDPLGKPTLQLHHGAAARAAALSWRDVSLSLSHARDHAIALVVAIGN